MSTFTTKKTYFISSKRKQGHWSSVYNYLPKNKTLAETRGEIFAAINLKTDKGFDAPDAGNKLLDRLHENYFESKNSNNIEALAEAIYSVKEYLEELIKDNSVVAKKGVELDISALIIDSNVASFIVLGQGNIKIIREDQLTSLVEELDNSQELKLGSIFVENGDKIFIGTEESTKELASQTIKKIARIFDVTELKGEKSLSPDVSFLLVEYLGSHPEVGSESLIETADKSGFEKISDSESEVDSDEAEFVSDLRDEQEELVVKGVGKEEIETTDENEGFETDSIGDEQYEPRTYKAIIDDLPILLNEKLLPLLKSKNNLIMLVVSIIVLVGLAYFSIKDTINNQGDVVAEQKGDELQTELENSIIKLEKDTQDKTNRDEKAEIEQFKSQVTQLESRISSSEIGSDLKEEFLNRILVVDDLLAGKISLVEDNPIVDIAALFPDAQPQDIAISDGKLFVADSNLGKIYQLEVSNPEAVTELVDDVKGAHAITIDDSKNLFFVDDNEANSIAKFSLVNNSLSRIAGTSVSKVGYVSELIFTDILDGRIYAINTTGANVFYLQRTGGNYSLPSIRFNLPELAKAKDIAISDLKIYIQAPIHDGIYRYANDQDDSPAVAGIADKSGLQDSGAMEVTDTNIYIADNKNKQIDVLTKEVEQAKLIGAYTNRTSNKELFTQVHDLVVDESSKKAFVLNKTSIYVLDLQKLNDI